MGLTEWMRIRSEGEEVWGDGSWGMGHGGCGRLGRVSYRGACIVSWSCGGA